MQWSIAHPRDRTWLAQYGVDEHGPWASTLWNGVVVRYDLVSEAYDFERPIRGLVGFLSQLGFVGMNDVEDALTWIADPLGCGRRPRRGVRRALRVIENLGAGH